MLPNLNRSAWLERIKCKCDVRVGIFLATQVLLGIMPLRSVFVTSELDLSQRRTALTAVRCHYHGLDSGLLNRN